MNLFDLGSLIVIVGFCLWGTIKGFIIEISEIGGLILSFILALYFPLGLDIGGMKYIVSFLAYFFIISILFSILSKIIHKTPLAFIDRILGAAIGAIKGLIVVIILFLIISLIPFNGTKNNVKGSFFYKTALIVRIPVKDFLKRKTEDLDHYKEKIQFPQIQEKTEESPTDKRNIL
jgi:membrane protein required for colicin V production